MCFRTEVAKLRAKNKNLRAEVTRYERVVARYERVERVQAANLRDKVRRSERLLKIGLSVMYGIVAGVCALYIL